MTGPYKTDIGKLAYIGKQGVLCLMSESEYADRTGYTAPNNRIASTINDVFMHNEGRIIITVFTNHISRLQELFSEVAKTQRKIVIMGRKLQNLVNYVIDNGYVNFDKEKIGSLNNINDRDSVILISNENEKPFMNLDRIVNGYDKYIKINNNDTVFFLEPVAVGMEKKAVKIIDELSKMGANVITLSSKTHLLNHASQEDLMLMINLMNPKYYFPVIGEYRHQVENANIAHSLGMNKENILLKQNGFVATIENGKLVDEIEKIKVDELLIDGNSTKDIGELVLKDRELLSDNGIVIICATLDKKTKELLGFIYITWWANNEETEEYKNIIKQENKRKKELYNINNIFKYKKNSN